MTSTNAQPKSKLVGWVVTALGGLFLAYQLLGMITALPWQVPAVARAFGHRVYVTAGPGYEGLKVARQSPDGRLLAAGGSVTASRGDHFDGRLVVWDAVTLQRLRAVTLPDAKFGSVDDLRWAPDSRSLAVMSSGVLYALDSQSGRLLAQVQTHQYTACVLAFVPGGLLTTERSSERGPTSLVLRSWPSLSVQWRQPLSCSSDSANVSIDAAGTLLAYAPGGHGGSLPEELRVLDLRTRTALPPLTRRDASGYPQSLAVNEDGRTVAAGYEDGTVIVWDAQAGRELWRSRPHGNLVVSLAWSPDGRTLASSGFGRCGRWRSECLAVSRRVAGTVQSRVIWNDTYNVPTTLNWLAPNQMLVTVNRQARVVRVPAE